MEWRVDVVSDSQRRQQVTRDGLCMEDLHQAWLLESDADVVGVIVAEDVDRDARVVPDPSSNAWSNMELLTEGPERLLVPIAEQPHNMDVQRVQHSDQLGDPYVRRPLGDGRTGARNNVRASRGKCLDDAKLVRRRDEEDAWLGCQGYEVSGCIFRTCIGLRGEAPALRPQGQVCGPNSHVEEVDIQPVDDRINRVLIVARMQGERA